MQLPTLRECLRQTAVEKIILTTLDRHARLLTQVAKEALKSVDLQEIEEFKNLRKDNLVITLGKYRGSYKEIFKCLCGNQ